MKKIVLLVMVLLNSHILANSEKEIKDHPEIKNKKELIKLLTELKEKKDQVNYKNYVLNLVALAKIKLTHENEVLNAYNLEASKFNQVLNKSIDFDYDKTEARIGESCHVRKCSKNAVCNLDLLEGEKACRPKASLCQVNSECCSGVCQGAAADVKGRCAPSIICHQGLFENEECQPKFNLCLDKIKCKELSHLSLNIGECKLNQNKCNQNSDCCSDNCVSGLCSPKFTCQRCVNEGAQIKGNQKCCDGLKPIKGKNKIVCTQDLPI